MIDLLSERFRRRHGAPSGTTAPVTTTPVTTTPVTTALVVVAYVAAVGR
jgi:hypothetical protein